MQEYEKHRTKHRKTQRRHEQHSPCNDHESNNTTTTRQSMLRTTMEITKYAHSQHVFDYVFNASTASSQPKQTRLESFSRNMHHCLLKTQRHNGTCRKQPSRGGEAMKNIGISIRRPSPPLNTPPLRALPFRGDAAVLARGSGRGGAGR